VFYLENIPRSSPQGRKVRMCEGDFVKNEESVKSFVCVLVSEVYE
jgi:hypothetical protein